MKFEAGKMYKFTDDEARGLFEQEEYDNAKISELFGTEPFVVAQVGHGGDTVKAVYLPGKRDAYTVDNEGISVPLRGNIVARTLIASNESRWFSEYIKEPETPDPKPEPKYTVMVEGDAGDGYFILMQGVSLDEAMFQAENYVKSHPDYRAMIVISISMFTFKSIPTAVMESL